MRDIAGLERVIDAAWEERDTLSSATKGAVRDAVDAALDALDCGADTIAAWASLAKARAGDTLHLASNEFVQMHGGIGMTDVHDSGLYLKRARVAEWLYGGAAFHRDRYARLAGY